MSNLEIEKSIPDGRPQLGQNYWQSQKKADEQGDPINNIFDSNANAALGDISIFGKKKI